VRSRRNLVWALAGLLLTFVVIAAVLLSLSLRQRNNAQAFMRDYVQLKLGTSSFSEAQRLARTYGGIPWYIGQGNMTCTFQRCILAFKVENKSLSGSYLARYTGLFAFVSVRQGVVVSRQLEYEHSSRSGYEFRYLVFDGPDDPTENRLPFGTTLQVDSHGVPRTVVVRLGPASSTIERDRAYTLDLACLARLHDCGVPSSYFPHGLLSEGRP
jgi:hypothetical protein